MQGRKRVCDVCPNRGNCPNVKYQKENSNYVILSYCSFARDNKAYLAKSFSDLAIAMNDLQLLKKASELISFVGCFAVTNLQKQATQCNSCSFKKKCPFVDPHSSSNGFLMCPKENNIRKGWVRLALNDSSRVFLGHFHIN